MHDFTREEILSVLAGLGIELPPATKLPHEALQKRLKQSLLAAQSFFNVYRLPLSILNLSPNGHCQSTNLITLFSRRSNGLTSLKSAQTSKRCLAASMWRRRSSSILYRT